MGMKSALVYVSVLPLLTLYACQNMHKGKSENLNTPQTDRKPTSVLSLHRLENPQNGMRPMSHEAEQKLIELLAQGVSAKIKDVRDAHPKAHACVMQSTFKVNPKLAVDYQTGVFKDPG